MISFLLVRLVVIIQLLTNIRCQDAFGDRDSQRYQPMSSDDGQIETITGFSIIQREPDTQIISTTSQQYQYPDSSSKNEDYSRSGRKKIYRIKNSFLNQVDENEKPQENMDPQDSSSGASNQYTAMQYSLPPEEFLRQLRAENQYFQQQYVSTPAPNMRFTVTPQPLYQYPSSTPASYDNTNQQLNHIQSKYSQSYLSSPSSYQYSTPNTFMNNDQSTPSSTTSYLSTPMNGHYVGTQSASYVSSSSPIYLSSAPNLQQYVSSPLSVIDSSPNYSNNRIQSILSSNILSYENDPNKQKQNNNYDYSTNNFRYPLNIQQQYQNDYTPTITTTTSAPYSMQESSWPSGGRTNNALSKPLQELSYTHYPNYSYNNNQQDTKIETIHDNNRSGSMASANNVYLNYVPADNQMISNLKIHPQSLENETSQREYYSNGDYGWKLNDKKASNNQLYTSEFSKYQTSNLSPNNVAVSQMNFHMETNKPYKHDSVKSSLDNMESQDFSNVAANINERLKQQQQYYNNNYSSNNEGNSYYMNDKQKNKYTDDTNLLTNHYTYSNTQNDFITASPYHSPNTRDNTDKTKQTFDHDKAVINIVPIEVSSIVSNQGISKKEPTSIDYKNNYSTANYAKDQLDQHVNQLIQPVSDSYYKNKNIIYNLNSKNKPDEYVTPDSLKQIGAALYSRQEQQGQSYIPGSHISSYQNIGYSPQASIYQNNMQLSSNPQSGLQRNPLSSDIASLLKLNDVPYKISQGLSNDVFKLHNIDQNGNLIPTPLPTRLNQNVDSHQLDAASNLINKLMLNKQTPLGNNRPEINSQANLLPTINGIKVVNPFNLDLTLVAEMLKGKPTVDDPYMISMRDTFAKSTPLKLDLSQLQHILNSENTAHLGSINDGFSALSNPYMDIYNNGRFPYQNVKHSRSQEEEESLPISDPSSNYPIGAVIEQDDTASGREVNSASDLTAQGDDPIPINFEDTRMKQIYMSGHRVVGDRHRNLNSLSGRHFRQRKHPKADVEEPYPLLKPPPRHLPIVRSNSIKMEKSRRRRITKP